MDNDMSGGTIGVDYDYGFRIYNSQIGKFLSVDPLTESYPWFTPYQFSQNDPIRNIDIDGLEGGSAIEYAFSGLAHEIEGAWDYASYQVSSWWDSWSFPLSSTNPIKPAPPVANDKTKPVIKKNDAQAILGLNKLKINSKNSFNIDLSDKVSFISQQTLPKPGKACWRASSAILKASGIEKGGVKDGRIITGKTSTDKKTIVANDDKAKAGVDYIDQQLGIENPVLVGMDYNPNNNQSDGEPADHYVVIVGKGYDKDKKQNYYHFYEVGTADEIKGKSDKNRLYVTGDNTIRGTNYAGKKQFVVTDVRTN